MRNTIFVQIASYKDPELIPTLDSLFENSRYPNNVKVVIAWQHDESEDISIFDKPYKKNLEIIDIPWNESKGVCWARNQIQQRYDGEKYTLQLDSHHRFTKNWDTKCIGMVKQLQKKGYKKPLITAYMPSFNPDNDPESRVNTPWKMLFDRFIPEGAVFFLPANIPEWEKLKEPIPSRFYSAHFAFTLGQFCNEVQHDPNMYFHGEEISIAVRAFTHGYDLFHPHEVIAWHEYTRMGRTKHWDDNSKWIEQNKISHNRNRILFGMEEGCTPCMRKQIEPYGFGNDRTLEDYERYAGIRFRDRSVQQHTLDNGYPPNPPVEDYESSFYTIFKHCIDLHIENFKETDYEFWAVIFKGKNNEDIFRKDCDREEIIALLNNAKNNNGWVNIWREYNGPTPSSYVVWPYSTGKGWCEMLTGNL